MFELAVMTDGGLIPDGRKHNCLAHIAHAWEARENSTLIRRPNLDRVQNRLLNVIDLLVYGTRLTLQPALPRGVEIRVLTTCPRRGIRLPEPSP